VYTNITLLLTSRLQS